MEQQQKLTNVTILTAEQYDDAVHAVMRDMADDPDIEGMSKVLIPLTGLIFVKRVRDKLFGEPAEK